MLGIFGDIEYTVYMYHGARYFNAFYKPSVIVRTIRIENTSELYYLSYCLENYAKTLKWLNSMPCYDHPYEK